MDDLRQSTDVKDAERFETLSDVNTSCSTAIDILNDLLCFEKLESGILELHKTNEPILPFIQGCVNMFSAQARECEVSLELITTHAVSFASTRRASRHPPTELLPSEVVSTAIKNSVKCTIQESDIVHIDKFKMDQVVRNLISNALKFSPRGTKVTVEAWIEKAETQSTAIERSVSVRNPIQRRISTSVLLSRRFSENVSNKSVRTTHLIPASNSISDPDPDMLVVSVTDQGAGISHENQQRLFKEIVQFNPEKLQAGGGSGFGLFITKGIVDLHGGAISVFSVGEGHGCTFTVSIPMVRNGKQPTERYQSFSRSLKTASAKVAIDDVDDSMRTSSQPSIKYGAPFDIESGRKTSNTSASRVDLVLDLDKKNHCAQSGDSGGGLSAAGGAKVDMQLDVKSLPSSESRAKEMESKDNGVLSPKSHHLLVVDDSHLNRKMLCKLLRGAGHTCDEADDGDVAVEKVKELMRQSEGGDGCREYDCILMDYVMPRMEGPKAVCEIRKLGYKGRIVGLTGNGLQSDIDYYLSQGANQVFVKPLDVDAFRSYMLST
jgi:signal transduction histidine kinase/CheY-like chemotaxis protein